MARKALNLSNGFNYDGTGTGTAVEANAQKIDDNFVELYAADVIAKRVVVPIFVALSPDAAGLGGWPAGDDRVGFGIAPGAGTVTGIDYAFQPEASSAGAANVTAYFGGNSLQSAAVDLKTGPGTKKPATLTATTAHLAVTQGGLITVATNVAASDVTNIPGIWAFVTIQLT
jgi:hypothetical protein